MLDLIEFETDFSFSVFFGWINHESSIDALTGRIGGTDIIPSNILCNDLNSLTETMYLFKFI